MEFIKIKTSELLDFYKSSTYSKLEKKPISKERVYSYINNPNADVDDNILYLLKDGNTLVAFRTLMIEMYEGIGKFAWFSGNWVNPVYRRKGFSQQLLDEIVKDWGHKLMHTNSAPESYALYKKNDFIHPVSERSGFKYYLFAKTHKLLAARTPRWMQPLLKITDAGIAVIATLSCLRISKKKGTFIFEANNNLDETYLKLYDEREKAGFIRGKEEMIWIDKYPWINQENNKQEYFFSHTSKRFFNEYITIYKEKNAIGFAHLQYRDAVAKIPYIDIPKEAMKEFVDYLLIWCKKHKIDNITIWHTSINTELSHHKHPFIYKKTSIQKIFSAHKIECSNHISQDGEGDFLFT